jgi:hypothetical protein
MKSENEEAGKRKEEKIKKISKKNQSSSRQYYVWKEKGNEYQTVVETRRRKDFCENGVTQ